VKFREVRELSGVCRCSLDDAAVADARLMDIEVLVMDLANAVEILKVATTNVFMKAGPRRDEKIDATRR
jgi:hypothetical protein